METLLKMNERINMIKIKNVRHLKEEAGQYAVKIS